MDDMCEAYTTSTPVTADRCGASDEGVVASIDSMIADIETLVLGLPRASQEHRIR